MKLFSSIGRTALLAIVVSNAGFASMLPPLHGKQIYFGNLHAHTKYSDGRGTPEEGYIWARDHMNYDFYAITDHGELLSAKEWDDIGEKAQLYTQEGEFLALRGFEYTHIFGGHISIYNTATYTSSLRLRDLGHLYRWIKANDALAQFNHPGRGNFNKLQLNESIKENVFAIEVGNGNSSIASGKYSHYYQEALDKGWRVAPTNNLDNHSLHATGYTTAIIADDLTKESLFDALQKRRVYAVDDNNMEIFFTVNNQWLGSIIPPAERYTIHVEIMDDEPIEYIEIVANHGKVLRRLDYKSEIYSVHEDFDIVEDEQLDYLYLRVHGVDMDHHGRGKRQQMALTAPVWIDREKIIAAEID